MVLKLTDRMADEIDDEVGRCLRELIAIQTWTGDERLLFEKLEKLVERERYFGELLTAVFLLHLWLFCTKAWTGRQDGVKETCPSPLKAHPMSL